MSQAIKQFKQTTVVQINQTEWLDIESIESIHPSLDITTNAWAPYLRSLKYVGQYLVWQMTTVAQINPTGSIDFEYWSTKVLGSQVIETTGKLNDRAIEEADFQFPNNSFILHSYEQDISWIHINNRY